MKYWSQTSMEKRIQPLFNGWVLYSSLICTFVVSGRKIQKTAKYEEQWMNSQQLNEFWWYYHGLWVALIKLQISCHDYHNYSCYDTFPWRHLCFWNRSSCGENVKRQHEGVLHILHVFWPPHTLFISAQKMYACQMIQGTPLWSTLFGLRS